MKNQLKIMLLFVAVMFTIGCEKEDPISSNVAGSLTAKFNFYNATTQAWSAPENFTATSVITTKSNNDYTIVAKDVINNTVLFSASAVTAVGTYAIRGTYKKGTVDYNSGSGQMVVSAISANGLTATVILENQAWSFYDGKLTATF